ncbi:MAG: protein kinase [Bryobacteraceae bacterium]|nr:protein kinase [Bryobacteraceae bacterium]
MFRRLQKFMVGERLSHYRVEEKLGEGGMGVVYRGVDETLGRQVAIKLCKMAATEEDARRRILNEARTASALTHPNVAHIYEYGETARGEPFIVMELVDGRSLGDILKDGPLPFDKALTVIRSIASALSEAHRLGIVHRDIKPSNVCLNNQGVVKVLDFGLARHAPLAQDQATMTVSTRSVEVAIQGTPLYMSPEQVRGTGIDARTDLFSLGAVLYECLTGRTPFLGGNNIEVLAKVIGTDPPPPSSVNPGIPKALDRVTMKLLAKAPEARYQSAQELLSDLADPRPPAVTKPSILSRRHTLAAAGVCALVAAAIWFRPVSSTGASSVEAARWYEQGVTAIREGAYHKASKALERAVTIDPRYAMAQARLAEAWLELDYTGKARDAMLKALPPGKVLSGLAREDMLQLEAIHHAVTGDAAAAVEKYQQLAAIRTGPEKAAVLLDLGRAQERAENTRAAAESYSAAIAMDSQSAAAYLRLAALQIRRRDFPAAGKALGQAENLYRAASNVEGASDVSYQRALLADRTGDRPQAWQALKQSMEAARVTGNQQQQIRVLLKESELHLAEGRTAEGQRAATQAVELARENGIENLTSRALIDLGNSLFLKGEIADARSYLQQALKFARDNKAARTEARALANLGGLRIQTGETEQGWRDVEEALAFYRRGGYGREAALTLVLLGRALRKKGDAAAALRAFDEGLKVAPGAESQEAALAREGIGSVLAEKGDYPSALSHYAESRRIHGLLANPRGSGYAAASEANMLARLGRFQEASQALRDALTIAQTGRIQALEAVCHRIAAEMEWSRGNYPASLGLARKARDIADRAQQGGAGIVLCLAEMKAGNPRAALPVCRQAADLGVKSNDVSQQISSSLALAYAALAAGDAPTAREAADHARQSSLRHGHRESEWRAGALVAAAGDRAAAAPALTTLEQLLSSWPAASRAGYLARPDIRGLRALLDTR